jgi:transcriptional regulator with XRE-family HTH domain
MDPNHIIGNNIRYFRDKLGLTQEELASFLSINREEISYFENGKRSVPSGLLTRLAELFGLDEIDFYEQDSSLIAANTAFAFRSVELAGGDLHSLAAFRKVTNNYIKMKKLLTDGK